MLTNDLKHLLLMSPVRADHRFMGKDRNDEFWNNMANEATDADLSNRRGVVWDGINFIVPGTRNRIARLIVNTYANLRLMLEPKKNVIDTFNLVKNSLNKMETMSQADIEEYQEFINENYSEFQQLTVAGCNTSINMLRKENTAGELYEYITEAQVVEFVKQSERGLALSELYFYGRTIPPDCADKIKDAIELQVFDNVYIMYYTPVKNQFFVDVIKEQAKKRDPIAFGVISGSDKLFFIDDWEDEFCNLRFSDIKKYLAEKKCETGGEDGNAI